MNKDPLITINVSKSQTLVFYEHLLIYNGVKINYKDIQGIAYSLTRTKHSVYFIPTHTSSSCLIKIKACGKIYQIVSSASSSYFSKGKSLKEKEEIFAKLVYVLDNLIKPFVMINLLFEYAKDNLLKLDSLAIAPEGLYKKRFWRKPELLPWDQYYNSILSQGSFTIYKKDEIRKYKFYYSCPMYVMNAVVSPDLLNFLFQKNGVLDKVTIKELEMRKNELASISDGELTPASGKKGFCKLCGTSVEIDQKFCTHCGSKLT